MAGKKIRNPLLKRVPREFIGDWKKYIIVTLFLVVMIGATAGVYVANNSMMAAFDSMEETYILEDGHFELNKEADEELLAGISSGEMADIRAYYIEKMHGVLNERFEEVIANAEERYGLNSDDFEAAPVTIYENFFVNLDENEDSRIRVFTYQTNIDLPCIHEGRLPNNENEIAIDRMHADNANISVGDVLTIGGREMEVVGLISLANYTTLHENNTDTMFNALTFDVGLVTEEGFEALSENRNIHYMYSWIYNTDPTDKIEEKKVGDNFLKALITQVVISENEIEDFIPAYANQAIIFAPDDVGGDMAMIGVLLYIFIGIIAFIFAVTISSTIAKEAAVIGTLRSSGYTKGELIAHYMAMPIVVTLLSAVAGNVLGYTMLKDVVKNLYYNSYSLPVFKTLWSSEAFVKTTIIPLILVLLVNLAVITYKLRLSPLKFLRHDLKGGKKRNAVKLPNWKFFTRFRARILTQNRANYLVLGFGVIFVMFLMTFANAMPDTLNHIKDTAGDTLFVDYQVILKSTEDDGGEVITTSNSDAEKFSITELLYRASIDEGISVYGFMDDSRYFELPELGEGEVVISDSFADKYGISVGDVITLDEEFENVSYEFKIAQIKEDTSMMAIFMDVESYNEVFDLDEDDFSGFLSATPIEDIPEKYIATTITINDLLVQVNQLDHSMGSMLDYFGYVCVIMAAVLIYLLTKIIIEKNETAISMSKILGYKQSEIASLYLMSTTWVMLVVELVAVFAGRIIMSFVWKIFLRSMPGWYPFYMENLSMVKIFILVFVAFLVIMFFDYNRIRRIPMTDALKNVE